MKSLQQGVEEYLDYRWRLGFKLLFANHLLNSFVLFMNKNCAKHITTKLALEFATINPDATPASWASRLGIIRRFALYWSTVDLKTEIPPKHLISPSYKRRCPHIYTDMEIINLLQCTESGFSSDRLEQYSYFVLFGLLAVTGMRVTEALTLDRDAVDIHNMIITINKSKFRKSRYIPIHKSTAEVLKNFANYRDCCFPVPTTSWFFVNQKGDSLAERRMRHTFRLQLIKIGLEKSTGSRSPRMVDLRHTFAVKTLLRWYKAGVVTIDHYVPLLATYLGHVKPSNTYWYLTATPQLLKIVTSRREKYRRRIKL